MSIISYGIEVKDSSGKKWLKFRAGGRQGPQVVFATDRMAFDWLCQAGLINGPFQVKEIINN